MKKTAIFLLCLIMLLTLFGCKNSTGVQEPTTQKTTSDESQKPKKVLKIGVFETLDDEKTPAELSLEYARSLKKTVSIKKEKYSVKLVFADAGTTKQSAVEAAKKLVLQKVSAVIAGESTNELLDAVEIFKKANIAVIEAQPYPLGLSEKHSNVFNLCTNDFELEKKAASFASKKLKSKKAYVLCNLEDESSVSRALFFKEAAEGCGIKCKIAYFEESSLDMSEFVLEASGGKYDLFYAPVNFRFCFDIFKECAAAKATFKIVGSASWDCANVSKYNLEIYAPSVCKVNESSKTAKGFSSWIEQEKNKSGLFSKKLKSTEAMYIDSYNFALKAVTAADSANCAAVLKEAKTAKINGISGTLSFGSSNVNKNAIVSFLKIG